MNEEIPGVQAIERPVWAPGEWITTKGKPRWKWSETSLGRCEDCHHCILDYLNDNAPAGIHPPGLARAATWSRVQARKRHIFCEGHAALRREQEKEAANDQAIQRG